MPIFKSKTASADSAPEEKWIPYRENGEVKYMRAEEAQDSTATGATLKHVKPSGWGNMPGFVVAQAPQLLQEKYTDDSIIAVIVTNVVPAQKPKVVEG